jgi:regulator of sirC expression with transglutaminase-like and TPR domain
MAVDDPTGRFAELLARPEPTVAPGDAALLIAAHAHPDLDLDRRHAELDALAEGAPAEPGALAHHLFVELRFAGNRVDYGDPRNSYLDDVLTRRLGLPITLSVVMIEVARRVGVTVEGVGMPGHFLVRTAGDGSVAGRGDRYFDPFDDGAELTAEGCAARFAELHPGVAFDGAFLDPVGTRAIVTRMLANLEQTLLVREPAALVWVTRLRLLVPGLPPQVRRQLAARLGSLGAFSAAADVLDGLAGETGAPDATRDETAARALRARAN